MHSPNLSISMSTAVYITTTQPEIPNYHILARNKRDHNIREDSGIFLDI